MGRPSIYPEEFWREACELARRGDRSIRQVAAGLGIPVYWDLDPGRTRRSGTGRSCDSPPQQDDRRFADARPESHKRASGGRIVHHLFSLRGLPSRSANCSRSTDMSQTPPPKGIAMSPEPLNWS